MGYHVRCWLTWKARDYLKQNVRCLAEMHSRIFCSACSWVLLLLQEEWILSRFAYKHLCREKKLIGYLCVSCVIDGSALRQVQFKYLEWWWCYITCNLTPEAIQFLWYVFVVTCSLKFPFMGERSQGQCFNFEMDNYFIYIPSTYELKEWFNYKYTRQCNSTDSVDWAGVEFMGNLRPIYRRTFTS